MEVDPHGVSVLADTPAVVAVPVVPDETDVPTLGAVELGRLVMSDVLGIGTAA